MMVQTQKLEYPDHKEEIATLNEVLASLQFGYPQGFPERLQPTVTMILERLDQLMTAANARIKLYDQRENCL
jgi:hypothetical protein